ncbi:MAG: RpiB/LacA/LacB family sugar-phosphate isomerase [Chloroflexi bacterium]|nr:RpiB/LacA/LacB family sugar-phosphate isomerase [Chloroflexota bacterium]
MRPLRLTTLESTSLGSVVLKIVVGCDDPNEVTDSVVADLKVRGHQVVELAPEPWPDAARAVAQAVVSGAADQGVLFCWTGTGTAMAANKVPGVRAALVWDPWIAEGARRWNDANVLVMSSRRTTPDEARAILDAWMAVEAPDPDESDNIARLKAMERGGGA